MGFFFGVFFLILYLGMLHCFKPHLTKYPKQITHTPNKKNEQTNKQKN